MILTRPPEPVMNRNEQLPFECRHAPVVPRVGRPFVRAVPAPPSRPGATQTIHDCGD
jgi:hypothetical protein